MAVNLGLNCDCSRWVAAGLISDEEEEVRKIAWWGCYSLDKLVDRYFCFFRFLIMSTRQRRKNGQIQG